MVQEEKGAPVVPIVLGAAAVMAAMLGVVIAKETGMIENGLAKRLVGLTIAFMLVLCGNFLPKLGFFRSFMGADQARGAKAELMAGRILVLAGIVVMGIWAFAEISRAPLGAALIGLAALFLALASWLWLKPGSGTPGVAQIDQGGTETAKQRIALRLTILHILHAVAWVFVMLLADEMWGDQSIMWTVTAFIVSSGLITVLATALARARS